jgi:hypothetical protein
MVSVMKPTIGAIVTVYGHKCRVFRIHPAGTVDVVSLCGEYAWRVSGLAF